MNKKITLLIIITLLIVPEILLARAGGGGGTNGGGEIFTMILAFILAPFFLIYSAIMTAIMEQKRNKVKKLTRQLEKEDKMWNIGI